MFFLDCDVCNLIPWALFVILYVSFQSLGSALGMGKGGKGGMGVS